MNCFINRISSSKYFSEFIEWKIILFFNITKQNDNNIVYCRLLRSINKICSIAEQHRE